MRKLSYIIGEVWKYNAKNEKPCVLPRLISEHESTTHLANDQNASRRRTEFSFDSVDRNEKNVLNHAVRYGCRYEHLCEIRYFFENL